MDRFIEQLTTGGSLNLGLGSFVLCLFLSYLFALAAEMMYLLFYENRATGSQIQRSFILIGPAITLLFICVQLSLPLSLGLLGALSIVRFRTPIKEPEEIGFLMLLITASIAVATFNFLFATLLYIATFGALSLRHWHHLQGRWAKKKHGVLMLNMANQEYEAKQALVATKLAAFFKHHRLESITSTEGATNLQYMFDGTTTVDWEAFQKDLRNQVALNKINIFFAK